MRKYLLLLLLFNLPCLIYAQEILTLKRCLEIGLQQNYDIRLVRNEQEISNNNVSLGNAGYLPTLDLSAGYSGTLNDTKQKLTTGEINENNGVHNQTLDAGINLNWTVFDGFSIQTNYERLKELRGMGELNTRLTVENFISNLSAEYYNYIQQLIMLKNLKYAVKLSKERLRIVEARYNIGSSSRLEMQQAKVDFNADSSRLIKQYEVLYASQIELNQMMALDNVEQPILITDSVIAFNPSLDRNDIQQTMMASNTLLLQSKKNIHLSHLDLKTVNSQYYPYVRINAGYGITKNMYEVGTFDYQRNMGFNYGITLGFNIFDGFNRKRKKQNTKLEIENKELMAEQLELSLKSDLANMWMAYRTNMELTNLERENLETAKENYEIAMERYKLGDLAGIELREAQNSLLEAEERLVKAEYNTKLCEISLVQIGGQIINYLDI
jgi:outer membrane protein TolC